MSPNFSKSPDGLLPVIVQDFQTKAVLMLGYFNAEAFQKTKEEGKITFFSRSKNRLWTKGETTEHFLMVKNIALDCDDDTFLIQAEPKGPTCHTGADTCWNEVNSDKTWFINKLRAVIKDRKLNPNEKSYTTSLFQKGINKIAQKVGEEAVEIVIEAKDDNKELFMGEAADLLYHYLILLEAKGYELDEVMDVLIKRHQ
jgi:phosphoribosyl-AMP cyclohydrolase / phosphoribosyl-ATP pyrophosphohydrolase